jgi:hypothetical protein
MAQVTTSGFPRRALISVLLLTALSRVPLDAASAADGSLEYAVKATYLLNFTKFIDWPPPVSGTDSFNVCVVGGNPFGDTLAQVIAGETVNGRKMAVQILEHDPASGVCQILFFASQQEIPRGPGAPGRGVLTVGEGEAFARNGGIIGFVVENRRVTFYINLRAGEAAGLGIRSGLLAVAKSVIR